MAGYRFEPLTGAVFLRMMKIQLNDDLIVRYKSIMREELSKMKKTYKIDVDCANCANLMEDATCKTNGVQSATVNFMTLKMNVEFEEGQDPKAVMQEVRKACKKVEPDCEIFL